MSEQTVEFEQVNNDKTLIIKKVFAVLVTMCCMGGTFTGVMTFINTGYSEHFYSDWLGTFLFAAITAMPIGFVLMGQLTKVYLWLMPTVPVTLRNLFIGISMAFIMGTLMGFVTTLKHLGLDNLTDFVNSWFITVTGALPVGLTMMIIASLTIKPKLDNLLNR